MSIRLRVALVFALALAVAFALGSWLFITLLQSQLLAGVDLTLRAQIAKYRSASDVAAAGPVIRGPETFLIQIIDGTGRVTRHTSEAPAAPMLSRAQLGLVRSSTGTTSLTTSVDGEQTRVVAERVPGTADVAAAGIATEDTVSHTLTTATVALAIGGGVLVVLGGLGAFWLAAAALSPVERMRREVAALSARDASPGVQVPGTRDELAALAGTMNDLLGRLHEALARQRGFVADASHELRTPLAVLGAELELAGRPGRSRDELTEAVARAEDEVARLTRLTNDLLMLARSDEGRLPVRLVPADMPALLAQCASRAAGRAAEAGVRCVVEAPAGLTAPADEDRIGQAVDNLIANALRFAPAGSQVTVSAQAAGSGVAIEVSDAGPGFPAGFLPHAFERFRRPDTGRARSDGGAGLGLAIVAAIAAAHGGSATARNRPGGGATVRIELPGRADTDPEKPS